MIDTAVLAFFFLSFVTFFFCFFSPPIFFVLFSFVYLFHNPLAFVIL